MKKTLTGLLAAALLTAPLTLAAPAVAQVDSKTPVAAAAQADKANRSLIRVSHTGATSFSWYAEEVVKLTPAGGKTNVYLQINKGGGWKNMQRQTTLSNGTYDFGDFHQNKLRKYKNKFFNVGRVPDTYQLRVRVPGNSKFRPIKTLAWTVRWNG